MSWLKRKLTGIKTQPKRDVAAGVVTKCGGCRELIVQKELEEDFWICPKCGHHFRVPSRTYIDYLVDENSFEPEFQNLLAGDPLEFRDARMRYPERLEKARQATGLNDSALCGRATLDERPVAVAALDFFFMAGSMGSVMGEMVARTMELALEERRAMITITASGGARMQEGILSLMQMAKTSTTAAALREAHLPFVSILTDPSTAGVMASFASLGDVIIAEPGALIGFAGPRVIQDTIREELPEGFQRADFVLEHGFVDAVVTRREMRETVSKLIQFFYEGTDGFRLGTTEAKATSPRRRARRPAKGAKPNAARPPATEGTRSSEAIASRSSSTARS
jgi:acetyl-CoA carboxylase carboxyl transferase subunit beta